jgi:long-chain fatty acid transport protein
VLIEPNDRWRFGVTYRSKIDFEMEGDFDVDDTPPIFRALGLTDGDVEADVPIPQLVRASVYHQLTDDVAVMADVGWEDWSEMDYTPISGPAGATVEVPRNWHDTWHFGLGAEWRIAPRWLLQTGVAFDTSPVRDRHHNLPDQPSGRQWRFSAGVVHNWSESVQIGLNYTYIDFGRSPIDASNAFGRLAGDYEDFGAHVAAVSIAF